MDPAVESSDLGTTYSIELSNGASALKEIYYKQGRGSIFTYAPTRNPLRWAGLFVVVSEYFFQASSSNRIGYIVCFTMSLITTITVLVFFVSRAVQYLKWKKGVDTYLRELDEIGNQQLKLGSTTFELINKKETVIEKWSAIKKASITPELIRLTSESGPDYVFPAKAMDESNFQVLQGFIRQRMHSPQSISEIAM